MSCYFVAQITINDPEEYEKYLAGYDEIFARYRGKVVAVDDCPQVLEGGFHHTRIVITEFPDEGELKRWYCSVEYQELAKHRRNSSVSDILMVHGK